VLRLNCQGIPVAIVADALRRLEDELWFPHFEKNFYYFSNVVGLNRVVIYKKEAIKDGDIEADIRKRIEKIAGTDFDVCIWPKPSLTRRAKEYLKEQEVILSKLSPKVLVEKAFSKEDERKNMTEIWKSFLQYPDLPILEGENMLKDTIAQGVQTGTFGLAVNGKIR
jgi:hypothetical protein